MKSLMAQANWVVWRKDSERGKVLSIRTRAVTL